MNIITAEEFQSIIFSNPNLISEWSESFWIDFSNCFTIIDKKDSLPFD